MTTELTRRIAHACALIESGVFRDPVEDRARLAILKTRHHQAFRAFGADPTSDNGDAITAASVELDEACEAYRLAHFPNALAVFVICDRDIGQPLSIWAVYPTGPECVFEEEGER